MRLLALTLPTLLLLLPGGLAFAQEDEAAPNEPPAPIEESA
jgi:hypothetical protein